MKPKEPEGAGGKKFEDKAPPANLVQREQLLNNPYHSFIQTGFISDTIEILNQYSEPADDFAQIGEEPAKATPPELKNVAKADAAPKAKASGINEFDGTIHHPNGARYFPNGNKVDGVNTWVLAQEEPATPAAPATPATPAAPAKAGAADPNAGKNLNPYDGTEHKNGTRYFPDGKVVGGVNLNLGQVTPAELAVPPKGDAKAAPAKGPTSPVNEFDGTVHADGKRYFPDGKIVDGVNLWLHQAEPDKANGTAKAEPEAKGPTTPVNEFDGTVHADGKRYFPEDGKKVDGVNLRLPQAPSLRLTQIPKIRSFAQIIQPVSLAVNAKDAEPVGEPTLGVNSEKAPEPVRKLNPWDGLYHNADGTKDFSTGGKVGGVNNWI